MRRLELYRHMRRVRLLDETLAQLQRQGRIGFHGACTGQEAVPVGVAAALEPSDWVFPALRESCVMLVRGFPLARYVAQAFGSSLDVAKGRQMPSHQSASQVAVVSWSSCIGTQLPHAVGMALAARRTNRGQIAVAFLGDGATSHPDFHAALNFAGVFRAPCVLVCQNNQFAISTPVQRQSAEPELFRKAAAYGIPSERVDGNDVEAVRTVVTRAAAQARRGGGPVFIECLTFRIGPHSSSDDPRLYRDQALVERWQARDPIALLGSRLRDARELDDETDAALTRELHAEIARAIEVAEAASPPLLGSLFDDVFLRRPRHLEEQAASLMSQSRE